MKPIKKSQTDASLIASGKKRAMRIYSDKQLPPEDVADWTHSMWEKVNKHGILPPYDPKQVLYVDEPWRVAEIWHGENPGCTVEFKDGQKIVAPLWDGVTVTDWSRKRIPVMGARSYLVIREVYPEMLQDIPYEDAKLEGYPKGILIEDESGKEAFIEEENGSYLHSFINAWNSAMGKHADTRGWNANPLVWVVKFDVVTYYEGQAYDNVADLSIDELLTMYEEDGGDLCDVCQFSCKGSSIKGGPNGPIYPPCAEGMKDIVIESELYEECKDLEQRRIEG